MTQEDALVYIVTFGWTDAPYFIRTAATDRELLWIDVSEICARPDGPAWRFQGAEDLYFSRMTSAHPKLWNAIVDAVERLVVAALQTCTSPALIVAVVCHYGKHRSQYLGRRLCDRLAGGRSLQTRVYHLAQKRIARSPAPA